MSPGLIQPSVSWVQERINNIENLFTKCWPGNDFDWYVVPEKLELVACPASLLHVALGKKLLSHCMVLSNRTQVNISKYLNDSLC